MQRLTLAQALLGNPAFSTWTGWVEELDSSYQIKQTMGKNRIWAVLPQTETNEKEK